MAFGDLDCASSWSNTGKKTCYEDFGWDAKLVIVPDDASIATKTLAETLSTWTTAVNADTASRYYPLEIFFNVEEDSEETQYEEGADGKKLFLREGKRSLTGYIKLPMCLHAAYRTHNTRNVKAYVITSMGYIKGTSSDGTLFEPFSLNLFRVEKQTGGGNGETTQKTPVKIIFDDATEWDDRFAWAKPTAFNPLTAINGIQDVTIAVTSPTTSTGVLTVLTTCDLIGIDSLVKEDFVLVDDAGGAETITTMTSQGNGVYALAWTLGADNYILTMDDPADATTKGYEATSTATFTVS